MRVAVLAVVMSLVVAGSARADAPAGYACPPGVPQKGVGCTCPTGYASKRDASNYAVCVAKASAPVARPPAVQLSYDQLLAKANAVADSDCTGAEGWYVKALDKKPNGIEALVGSGVCFIETAKYASAHSRFRAALAVNPRYEGALWGVAEAYRRQNRRDDAIAAYRQYLDVYPGSVKAKTALDKLAPRAAPPPPPPPVERPATAGPPRTTADVALAITGSSLMLNGVELAGTPMLADVVAVLGKPDRVWGTGATGNNVHTWDRLGVVAFEPKDGRCISLTLPFTPMKQEYNPTTRFAGSIHVDGNSYSAATDLASAKQRPGATQPYSASSIVIRKGAFHVFAQAKTETATLDLVEISLWKNQKATPAPPKVTGTADVKVAVAGSRVTLNGFAIPGKPMIADLEAVLGKPDRVWDQQSSANRVHTWDRLGLVAYEPRDGRCISATFPFRRMGYDYDPQTLFGGSITVDGKPLSSADDIAGVKTRPGATQPLSASSVKFERGEVHVFTIGKAAGGKLDLVELSFWRQQKAEATPKPAAPAAITVVITGPRVMLNGASISGRPRVADFEAVLGKADRAWEKKGAANRIHTWDRLGVVVYEPYDGRAVSATFPFRSLKAEFSPRTLFAGAIAIDGARLSAADTLGAIKRLPGATTPYGAGSLVFDRGDLHVYTSAATDAAALELVELGFWQRDSKK